MLEALGLNGLEEHVYDRLVTHGRMSLDEMVAEASAKSADVALAVETLVTKGLVRRLAGPAHEYVVAPPEYALEVLIAQQTSALQRVRAHAADLAARVRSLNPGGDPGELVEIVTGQGSNRQLFLQVISSAREEIAVFDRPPYAVAVDEAMGEQAVRMREGLRLRTVFDRSLLEDPEHVRRIHRGVAAGEQARIARLPLKLVLIDRERAMLPLLHASGQTPEAVVIVRPSVLLDSLIALFESVWQHAVEVRPQNDLDSTGAAPLGELRQLAQLLATGMTDVAIARHLGVSERTVRRRLKELMDELRVDSRFLAGVRAAERGWL